MAQIGKYQLHLTYVCDYCKHVETMSVVWDDYVLGPEDSWVLHEQLHLNGWRCKPTRGPRPCLHYCPNCAKHAISSAGTWVL